MQETFADKIERQVRAKEGAAFSDPEKAVMAVLFRAFLEKKGRKVTQLEIARSERWMGCHPHEEDTVPNKMETTQRQVRQIIRDLRVKHGVPILASIKGYWFPLTEDEAREFLWTQERKTKAQVIAYHETRRAMREALGVDGDLSDDPEVRASWEDLD